MANRSSIEKVSGLFEADDGRFELEPLEPRLLLSADPLGTQVSADLSTFQPDRELASGTLDADSVTAFLSALPQPHQDSVDTNNTLPAALDLAAVDVLNPGDNDTVLDYLAATTDSLLAGDRDDGVSTRHEIIFVDTRTPDYGSLLADVHQRDNGIRYDIIILDANMDGIDQISEVLNAYHDVDAVHIIGHASNDAVQLGDTWLQSANLEHYAGRIAGWQDHLGTEADLLFYGCNLAGSETGKALIEQLSQLTGADVAASDDLTGGARLGGDWALEHHVGDIQTGIVVGDTAQQQWQGVLATHISQTSSNASAAFDSANAFGQSFDHNSGGGTYDVDYIGIELDRDGAATGTITMTLRDGWNGPVLASATKDAATLNESPTLEKFTFAPVSLYDMHPYTIRVEVGSSTGTLNYSYDSTDPYSFGSLYQNGSPNLISDLAFEVGSSGAPVFQNAGPYNIDEGASAGTAVGDVDADDGDGGAVDAGITYSITANVNPDADGDDAFKINVSTGEITVNDSDDIDYEVNTSLTITVQADDGIETTSTDVTIDVNDITPSISVGGAATVAAGGTYALELKAIDPGTSDITSYTVNWGDGTITTEAYTGPTTTVSHVYTTGGFTHNITVAATDGNGATWTASDLLVGNWVIGAEDIFRFDGQNGDPDGTFGPTGGDLNRPYAPVAGPDGNYYVSGHNSDNIVKFAADGSYLGLFTDDAQLNKPTGMVWGSDGNLYVANDAGNNILRISADGSSVIVWGTAGGLLDGPSGLAFGPDGDLYVASDNNHSVVKFDGASGGTPTLVIGSDLNGPEQIVFDAAGNLYIANGGNDEVAKWDGAVVTSYFTHPDLSFASGLAFGPDGQLYVSSFSNDKILRYDGLTGEVFADDGPGGLDRPLFLAFTPDHQVKVEANNAPTATNLSSTSSYNEGDASVVITDIVVSDANAGETITATLTLANTTTGSLSANDGATYTAATGVWSITDTVANVNTALANLTFTPTINNDLDTTINVVIDDGDEDASGPLTGTINLNVTPVNDIPVITTNNPINVTEESTVTITAAHLEATDPDNAPTEIVYTIQNLPSNAFVRLSGSSLGIGDTFTQDDINNGRVSYQDAEGPVNNSFQFTVSDGTYTSGNNTFFTNTAPVNDAPVNTVPGTQTVLEDTQTLITGISVADTDAGASNINTQLTVANGVLDITLSGAATISAGANGSNTLTISGNVTDTNATLSSLQYTGNTDVNGIGADTLTIFTNDLGNTGTGGTLSDTDSVLIDITPVNDAPVVDDDAFTVNEGSTTTLSLAANDTDVDDGIDMTSIAITGAATNGTIAVNADGTVDYTHDGSETLADSFSYTILDNSGAVSNTGTVNLTVTAVNDVPSAINLSSTSSYNEGDGSVAITDIVVSDSDAGETITATLTLANTATGSLSANDGASYNAVTGVWTITGTVANVNTALANLTFTPAVNNVVNTTIGVVIDDGDEDNSGPLTGTITLDVTPLNDLPSSADNSVFTVENVAKTFAASDFAFTDVETTSLVSLRIDSLPGNGVLQNGTVSLNAGDVVLAAELGSLTYTPNTDYNGSDSFTFSVSDGTDYSASPNTMTVTVNAVNTAPTSMDSITSTNEDQAKVFAAADFPFADVESASIVALRIDALPTHGVLMNGGSAVNVGDEVAAADLVNLSFTPGADFNGTDNFAFSVYDGTDYSAASSTMTIAVNAINDIPTSGDFSISTMEDATRTFAASDFPFADAEIDGIVALRIDAVPNNGVLMNGATVLNAGDVVMAEDLDQLSYTPNAGFNGSDSFGFSVSDGTAYSSAPSTVTANVTPTPVVPAPAVATLADPIVVVRPDLPVVDAMPDQVVAETTVEEADPVTDEVADDDATSEDEAAQATEAPAILVPLDGLGAPQAAAAIPDHDSSQRVNVDSSVKVNLQGLMQAIKIQLPGWDNLLLESGDWFDPMNLLESNDHSRDMDQLREKVAEDETSRKMKAGTGVVLTTSLTVGYVAYLVRGGVLLSSVLSTLPVWSFIDPTPILASLRTENDDDSDADESLESLVTQDQRSADTEYEEVDVEDKS